MDIPIGEDDQLPGPASEENGEPQPNVADAAESSGYRAPRPDDDQHQGERDEILENSTSHLEEGMDVDSSNLRARAEGESVLLLEEVPM